MNIVLVTQDSPFYLAESLDYLIANLPGHSKIQAAVVLSASPFGKRQTAFQKMLHTYRTFGPGFFSHYAWRFLTSRMIPTRSVSHVLSKHGVEIVTLEAGINKRSSLETLRSYRPDLIVSVQANVIFKKPLIELAPRGCLNVHTALLPKYRGLMPTFWVLKNDEQETGVSVFFIDEGIDSGPILVQERIRIGQRTLDQLIRDTKKLGMDALISAISLVESGDYQLIPNDDDLMTYYSFPTRDDVREFLRKGKRFF
jgi:methionyl-tRNA formyltransferase